MAVITKLPSDDAVLDVPAHTGSFVRSWKVTVRRHLSRRRLRFLTLTRRNWEFKTYIMNAGEEVNTFDYDGYIRFPDASDYSRNCRRFDIPRQQLPVVRFIRNRKKSTVRRCRFCGRISCREFNLSASVGKAPISRLWCGGRADIMRTMNFKTGKKGLVQPD